MLLVIFMILLVALRWPLFGNGSCIQVIVFSYLEMALVYIEVGVTLVWKWFSYRSGVVF